MLRAILFDKDGTLIDFQKSWGPALARVIDDLAPDPALAEALAGALLFDRATLRFPNASPFVAGATVDFAPGWARLLGRDATGFAAELDARLCRAVQASISPIGDAPRTLARLKAMGMALGVATNDAEAPARAQAGWIGLAPLLDFVAGYDSGHGAKPGPGMVRAFARAVGVASGDVAMVGDSRHDLQAAREAGALAVAVLSGPAGRDDLADLADYVLDDIAALPAWAARLRAG